MMPKAILVMNIGAQFGRIWYVNIKKATRDYPGSLHVVGLRFMKAAS